MPSRAPVSRAKAYLTKRHENLREALEALELDALLLTSPADLAYLTNFTGSTSVLYFSAAPGKGGRSGDGGMHLVTDFRYQTQARQQAAWLPTTVRPAGVKMSRAVADLLKGLGEKGPRKLGFEANFATYGQIEGIRRALGDAGLAVELVPLEDVMYQQRKVKDDHEINLIRKSVAVAEEAFDVVRQHLEPGTSEGYLVGMLIGELRGRGATDTSFNPIVAAGASSALPHYATADAPVKGGEPVLFDWGAVVEGYCSDLTRTFLLGKCDPKLREIYRVVLDAQETAIGMLRPGVLSSDADRAARRVIERAGHGAHFGHSLGHGIGRDIHELPSLRPRPDDPEARKDFKDDELRPGMVVTVEPGIYLPGVGGVRIEDDVLITHSGCEVLSTLPRSLADATIE